MMNHSYDSFISSFKMANEFLKILPHLVVLTPWTNKGSKYSEMPL